MCLALGAGIVLVMSSLQIVARMLSTMHGNDVQARIWYIWSRKVLQTLLVYDESVADEKAIYCPIRSNAACSPLKQRLTSTLFDDLWGENDLGDYKHLASTAFFENLF